MELRAGRRGGSLRMGSRNDRFGGLCIAELNRRFDIWQNIVKHFAATVTKSSCEIAFNVAIAASTAASSFGWMQLSLDHILPREAGGSDNRENLVTCCRSCNSITSRMSFASGVTLAQVIEEKCGRVRKRHADCLEFWKAEVVQSYRSPCAGSLAQSSSAAGCSVSESTPPAFITPPKDAIIPSKEPGHGIANSNHST